MTLKNKLDIYLLTYKGTSTMRKGAIWICLLCQITAPYILQQAYYKDIKTASR
jgi:hypothetical protein